MATPKSFLTPEYKSLRSLTDSGSSTGSIPTFQDFKLPQYPQSSGSSRNEHLRKINELRRESWRRQHLQLPDIKEKPITSGISQTGSPARVTVGVHTEATLTKEQKIRPNSLILTSTNF